MKFFTSLYFIAGAVLSSLQVNSQTFQWTWVSGDNKAQQPGIYGMKGIPSINNKPGSRSGSVSWRDVKGNLWLFGGLGIPTPATSGGGQLNDLWNYNPQTHEWKWVSGDSTPRQAAVYGTKGVEAATNKPGARQAALSWADDMGNLWLFGGSGYTRPTVSGYLNDLWRFNIANNRWTWMGGDSTINNFGIYGSKTIPSGSNAPGARQNAVSWTDANGLFYLFGGYGFATSGGGQTIGAEVGALNDLWRYNPATNQWAWISGDSTRFQVTVYGTKGVPSSTNKPGGRQSLISWTDGTGNLWLFGGEGYSYEYSRYGILNDLWRYNISSNQWTWESGDSLTYQTGVYGSLGVANSNNKPGGRYEASGWKDRTGDVLWLFGGGSTRGNLNDLWKFDIPSKQWTWVSGDSTASKPGIYGNKGVHAPTNKPGSRQGSAVSWTDTDGNLLLFGGFGLATSPTLTSYLNDLWQFTLSEPVVETIAFGNEGKVTTNAGGLFDVIETIKFQSDGKLVVAGTGAGVNFFIARYNSSGTLDNSFGINGKAVTAFGPGIESRAYDAAIQPDGKIVVAGVGFSESGSNANFALVRYNANGSLDSSFGTNGLVVTDYNGKEDEARSLVIQPDGKIVVAGWATIGNTSNFAISRYLTSGSLDPSFDGDGKASIEINPGTESKAYDIAIQSDGKIVMGGNVFGTTSDFALVRLNSDGSFDNTFNGTGKVVTDFTGMHDRIEALTIQANGMIIAAGHQFSANPSMPAGDVTLARYTTTGLLDNTFDGDGKVITDLGGNTDKATDVALQQDGKIIVTAIGSNNDFNVIRYNINGSTDNSFGANGTATKDFNNRPDYANSVEVKDNNIYIGGRTFNTTGDYFALAVIQNNSVLPLKLLNFTGAKKNNQVVLKWQATNIQNVKRFDIERSDDRNRFTKIGEVAVIGNNSATLDFNFIDPQSIQSSTYYRLHIVDANNSATYSNTLLIKTEVSTNSFNIFPNPVENVLQVQTSMKGVLTISISDVSGRIVKTQQLTSAVDLISIPIDVSGLTSGTYAIKLESIRASEIKNFIKN